MVKIPYFHDHHSHPLFYSAFGQGVSLESVDTKADANDLLIDNSKKHPGLTVAHGWRSNRFNWRQEELELLPPVAIFNVSLHSLMLNESGRKLLHDTYGSSIDRLDDREWYESNLRVVLNWFANLNASVEGLLQFFDQLHSQGIHSVEELLLVDEAEIDLFEQANLISRTKFWSAPDTFETLSHDAQQKVEGLKLFTDGAIGSRTAAMSRPYVEPATNDLGMLIYSDAQLGSVIESCLSAKQSLAIHAIGDRSIEQVISALEKQSSKNLEGKKVRLEHAQMITNDQACRAKNLGVCLSMQPNFNDDSVFYSDRIDEQYCRDNNPFRMLIDKVGFEPGDDLIFGSDGMPHGVAEAVRQTQFPSVETQQLSLDELVAGYTDPLASVGSLEIEIDDSNRNVKLAPTN